MSSHDDKDYPEFETYPIGDGFNIDATYQELAEHFAEQYPNNPKIHETMRKLLNDLKNENRVVYGKDD